MLVEERLEVVGMIWKSRRPRGAEGAAGVEAVLRLGQMGLVEEIGRIGSVCAGW